MDKKALVGKYVIKYAHGSETLHLGEDGKFVQIYASADSGQSKTNSGSWKPDGRSRRVVLTEAVLFDDGRGRRPDTLERTVWSLAVTKRFGEISLSMDVENVTEFKKVKSP